jgi:hypothetical protein
MDTKTAQAVKEDFLAWSGGFPPDSEQQIFVYIEYAHGANTDDVYDVRTMLRNWMQEEPSDYPHP